MFLIESNLGCLILLFYNLILIYSISALTECRNSYNVVVRNVYPIYLFSTLLRIFSHVLKETEAATGDIYKKVFLRISQNLQENTCAIVSFTIELQGRGPGIFFWKNPYHKALLFMQWHRWIMKDSTIAVYFLV